MSLGLLATATTMGALVLTALPAQAARADYAPGPNDIVGVGSDTLQYILDFGDDGDPEGDPGFNSAGGAYKVVSFDATADSNARAAYLNNSTDSNLLPLDPTDVLRAGTYPNERINGSGAGINALIANQGTSGNSSLPTIDFVRMSSEPTAAEGADFSSGLEVVKIATEDLAMAADNTTNAVALSPEQLVKIYQANISTGCETWSDFGVTGSAAGDWVAPLIPQAGSGTRSTFLSDLATLGNGGTAITLGTCVTTVEENDPTGITGFVTPTGWGGTIGAGVADPQDAIVPFSGSRLNLWNGVSGNTSIAASSGIGYFRNPANVYGTSPNAPLAPGVKQINTGTPSDGNAVYVDDRALNIVYPFNDNSSTTPGEPGSPFNWANLLFCPSTKSGAPTPFFDTPAGQTDIAEAGAVPSFSCPTTPLT
jgi:ABC-type phosphate transport system substrate-binding protein